MCLARTGGSGQPLGTWAPVHTTQCGDTKPLLLPMTTSASHLCHSTWPYSITGSNFYTWFFPLLGFQPWATCKLIFLQYFVEGRDSFLAVVWHSFKISASSIGRFWWCFTQGNNQNPNTGWVPGGTSNEGLVCITQIYCRNSVSENFNTNFYYIWE